MRPTLVVIAVLGALSFSDYAAGQEDKFPPGEMLLAQAAAIQRPLGVDAYSTFLTLKNQSFENNVSFSNAWIEGQLEFFDKTPEEIYKLALAPMINGGGEHGLGMRNWLTDSKNVAWWDNTVRDNVGEEGYARIVALNAAFYPGSREYLLTYGYDREYDLATNTMRLDGLPIEGALSAPNAFKFAPGTPPNNSFPQLLKYGDPVRKQMFSFYKAYLEHRVTPTMVQKFNDAYVKAGGCAMAASDVDTPNRSTRYLNALNFMSNTLSDLGFKSE
jgi:hypothetical protein